MILASVASRAQLDTAANAFARQQSADCAQSAAVDFWEALRVGTTRAPVAVLNCALALARIQIPPGAALMGVRICLPKPGPDQVT